VNQRYWDNLSGSFSKEVIELATEDLNGVLLEELDRVASKRRRVADLGCGPGVLIPYLVERFKSVCAVDFSKGLLKVAIERHSGSNVEFLRADLTQPIEPAQVADVTVCSSVLILASRKKRRKILDSIVRFTRPGGVVLITVPSLESCIHVYQTLIRLKRELGADNGMSRTKARHQFASEVPSVLDGNVLIQGVPTKHWMQDEITQKVIEAGLIVKRVRRVEYRWESEIVSPPEWLDSPYPWDWFLVATRPKS